MPNAIDPLVRPATRADAADVCTVQIEAIRESCVLDHHNDPAILARWLGNKTEATVARLLADPQTRLIVAECDGAVAGVGKATCNGEIQLCYVRPSLQGRQVGRALLVHLESWITAQGCSHARLNSTQRAVGFYQRMGYAVSGEPVHLFGLSATPMQKPL